jgi:hypothetical protein
VRDHFFVQERPRDAWHVESEDDPEIMLCGYVVLVDDLFVRVQKRWGKTRCPECERILSSEGFLSSTSS